MSSLRPKVLDAARAQLEAEEQIKLFEKKRCEQELSWCASLLGGSIVVFLHHCDVLFWCYC